jgi:ABC-2 type transport system permease protein
LLRDRLTGGMVAGIPLVLTLLFGYAINTDVRHLRGVIVDLANTSMSRALVADVQASQVIDWVERAQSPGEIETLLSRGHISAGLYIPPDFERRLQVGDRPLAQLLIDGSDPSILAAARGLTALPFGPQPGATAATFALRAFYNPERRSAVFVVPGLCAVILTLTMVLFTSIAIVRERERGNLELLITTPVSSLELMLGKIAPYIAIGYVQISIILVLGILLFAMPVRGSLADFYMAAGIFIISCLALGLLISTLASNQFQAFQMTYLSFLPQLLLSGFMFPFEGMPGLAQWLAEMFPITHFLRILRSVLLRDATLLEMKAEIWPMLLFFFIVIALTTLRFRKRLD